VWTVALEFSSIWFVLFMLYAANFKHIRKVRGPLSNGDVLAIIAGAGAVVGFALFMYIVIRMARKRKPAVPALLPVYVGFLAAGLCFSAIAYVPSLNAHGLFGLAAFLLFVALLADLLGPFLERKRSPQDEPAGSEPDSAAGAAGLISTGRRI